MIKAKDLGNYYQITPDTRDLNYNLFFSNGEAKISEIENYTSHNTKRLNKQETIGLLMKLQ